MAENLAVATSELFQTRPSVAVMMSGAGTNADVLLKNEQIRDLYDVRAIMTDNPLSNAAHLSREYHIPYIGASASRFSSLEHRERYFKSLADLMASKGIAAAFYAGFMKISTNEFTKRIPGVNVHPADLTIMGSDGLPFYRGMSAMTDMARDLSYVRATVHVIDVPVDSGVALSLSPILPVYEGEQSRHIHDRLKKFEHVLYPKTLVSLAAGDVTTNIPLIFDENQEYEL